jgi:hypothetical protein
MPAQGTFGCPFASTPPGQVAFVAPSIPMYFATALRARRAVQ